MEHLVTHSGLGTELHRHFLRPDSLWILTGYASLSLAVALFATTEHALELFPRITYLTAPTFLSPLAAHRISQDRENGQAAVHATTPLSRATTLTAVFTALALLLVIGLATTLPVLYALVHPITPGAFLQLLPLLAWAGTIGLLAIATGLVVGSWTSQGTPAISASFVIVAMWVILATQRSSLLALAETETQLTIIQALLHTSPVVWGLEALVDHGVHLVTGHWKLLTGLLSLTGLATVILGAVALGLQSNVTWLTPIHHHPVALTLLAASVATAGGLLLAWDYPPPTEATGPPPATEVHEDQAWQATMEVRETPETRVWSHRTPLTLTFSFTGPENHTILIEDLKIRSPGLSIDHDTRLPTSLTLTTEDTQPATPGHDQAMGHATLTVTAHAEAHRLVTEPILEAELLTGDTTTTLSTQTWVAGWALPGNHVLPAGAATVSALATLSFVTPRRLNRW